QRHREPAGTRRARRHAAENRARRVSGPGRTPGQERAAWDHTATADGKKPADWVAVLADRSLRHDTPTRVEADGVAVLLVKRGDRIFAITETCPHLGGPLSEGKLAVDAIQCPWHGHVVNGPTTFPARCFDVRVRDGQIEVRAAQ